MIEFSTEGQLDTDSEDIVEFGSIYRFVRSFRPSEKTMALNVVCSVVFDEATDTDSNDKAKLRSFVRERAF